MTDLSLNDYIKKCKGEKVSLPSKQFASKSLKLDNIGLEVTNKELYDCFSKSGTLTKCKLLVDKFGRSNGSAVVEYEKTEQAKNAKESNLDLELGGKKVNIKFIDRKNNSKNIKKDSGIPRINKGIRKTNFNLKPNRPPRNFENKRNVNKDKKNEAFGRRKIIRKNSDTRIQNKRTRLQFKPTGTNRMRNKSPEVRTKKIFKRNTENRNNSRNNNQVVNRNRDFSNKRPDSKFKSFNNSNNNRKNGLNRNRQNNDNKFRSNKRNNFINKNRNNKNNSYRKKSSDFNKR